MKMHSLKRIGMLALLISVVSFSGQAENKEKKENQLFPFYHNCSGIRNLEPVQIICKPDYTGNYLVPYHKYRFTYDEQNRVIRKEAYRWSTLNNEWTPIHQLTYTYDTSRTEIDFAKWNRQKNSYDPAKEKAVYETSDTGASSYTSYKRGSSSKDWKVVTDLSNLPPHQLITQK